MDINHPNYKKINNTFNRVMEQIKTFEKVFREGGKLEQAVLDADADPTHINEIALYLNNAYEALEEGHQDILGKTKVNEAEKRWKQTSMSPQEAIAKYGKPNVKVKKGALRNGDDMVEVFVEGYKIRDKSRGYGVADATYKTRKAAQDAAIMKAASNGGDWEVFVESKYSVGDEVTLDGKWHSISDIDADGDMTAMDQDGEEVEFHAGSEDHHKVKESANLSEGVLDGDDEDGFMARSQLYFLAQDAIKLHGIIGDRDNLAPWVQSKIAQASKDIDAVSRYTEYNAMKAEIEPEMEESYSQGDENEEGMVSNCCGAPIMDVYQGHGRCSDCKEMASAESVNEGTKGCADCEWIKDETDGDIDTCDECAAEKRKTNEANMDPASPELAEIFDNLKRGDKVKIKHDSALEKGTDYIEYIVKANNVLRNGVGKATLARADSPTSVKRFLYKRNGKVSMAIGDMAATLVDIQVSEGKYGKKKKYEAVSEEIKFDDKNAHSELKTVAQDMFKNALANAKKKSRKK